MPRTWSNVKYIETRSAAQRKKDRPAPPITFLALLFLCLVIFGGLIAYTMGVVIRHPVTEVHIPVQPPKDD